MYYEYSMLPKSKTEYLILVTLVSLYIGFEDSLTHKYNSITLSLSLAFLRTFSSLLILNCAEILLTLWFYT